MIAPSVLQAATLAAAHSPRPSPSASAGGGGFSGGAVIFLVVLALAAGGIGGGALTRRGYGIRPVTLDDQQRLAADRLLARLGMVLDPECRAVCVWLAQSEREHQQALFAALNARRDPRGPEPQDVGEVEGEGSG